MKILHVSDVYAPRLGGIERQVADLAVHQRTQGHDAGVLTSTAGAPEPGVTRLSSPWALQPLIRQLAPDVVHCHTSVISPLSWSAAHVAARAEIPTVLTMHSLVTRASPQSWAVRATARVLGERVIWSAVSRPAALALSEALTRRVHVVHNGVDPQSWRRSQVGSRPVLTVVSVMRLAARKRPLALMRTLAEVDRRLAGSVPWRAVLAGDGPQRTAVEWARRRHGLDDVVALPGRLEHPAVVDLLAEADLYVAPALLESFGIAALEARCSGVPVVAVRGTGVGEFVQDGVTGRLVNDPNQLADAVTELLSDRAQLTTLSAAGADDLSQAWPRIVERCGQLYDVAARRRSTTHPPSSAMR